MNDSNVLNFNINEHNILMTEYMYDHKDEIISAKNMIVECFERGNKLLIFGNGGSASDSQHIAGEFMNRIKLPVLQKMPAISLSSDIAVITAISNDINYNSIFSSQIDMLGNKGDIAIGLSTSGLSENYINGMNKAIMMGIKTISFTGNKYHKVRSNLEFKIPSESTTRIQEITMFLLHNICELVENYFYKKENF